MVATVRGRISWELDRDKDGHRDYTLESLVITDDVLDGPGWALLAPDLPVPGSYWQYGNELDPWAYCSPEVKVKPIITNEPAKWWKVTNYFSTRPLKRCQDSQIENPLLEPLRISGSFNPKEEERYIDKNGNPIWSSARELFRGKEVEFDVSKPTVKIGMNIPTLPLDLFAPMMHMLNDSPLWGLNARCVKLSNATWSRQLYGSCSYFYTVDFDFDIEYNTFDRPLFDTGTLFLKAGGDPNKPADYDVYKTDKGERTRVWLDGAGHELDDLSNPVTINVQYYPEGNLLFLGIPSFLG